MNKEQWQELYNKLNDIHSKFLIANPLYLSGRNKKIRDKAQRDIEHILFIANEYISENWEAYELLTGGPDNNDYSRAITYDEFVSQRYFGRDVPEYLEKIQLKIDSLN